ncbi:MAG: hypothetical protein L3J17_03165 [Candidatus Jettenia sp.]|nr:MAG: hypothetical protein L3J17_03165 [Candidatus Jettenia sp.]
MEIGISTLIFIFSFYFVIKFFPYISKIFSLVIVIVFGIALIYMNYYFLKMVKKDAPFKQLLVGDLFVSKIVKTIKRQPVIFATREKFSGVTSKYEKHLPAISLDQLKKLTADLTMAGPELSYIIPLELVMKEKPLFLGERYEITPIIRDTGMGFHDLGCMKKCESMIQGYLDRDCFVLLSHDKFVQETPITTLEVHKTWLSLSEKAIGITFVMNLHGPLKGDRISTD